MKHLYTPSFTIFRCDFLYITEIRESIDIWIGYDDEITTTTTITSKRPTFGPECGAHGSRPANYSRIVYSMESAWRVEEQAPDCATVRIYEGDTIVSERGPQL
jgi:hypothetical protein